MSSSNLVLLQSYDKNHDILQICPISNKKFKCPMVTSCGHTFDKESIINLLNSICPLCKAPFNKKECVPNWILINYLDLNIKFNDTLMIMVPYTAKEAKQEVEKTEINYKLLIDIEKKNKKRGYFR